MQKILSKDAVCFLVVHSSYTSSNVQVSLDSIYQERVAAGFSDVGYHFLIDRRGALNKGVPADREGSHTARYADSAIGVILAGGKSTRGQPADNYTLEQKQELKRLINHLRVIYPAIKVLGAGQLLGGKSPFFNLKEYTL